MPVPQPPPPSPPPPPPHSHSYYVGIDEAILSPRQRNTNHPDPDTLNNSVYTAILKDKSKKETPKDVDNDSRVTTPSIRYIRRNAVQSPRVFLDPKYLEEKCLVKDLRGTEVATETIALAVEHVEGSVTEKKKLLLGMIGNIAYIKTEDITSRVKIPRMLIETKDYLLCLDASYGGYDGLVYDIIGKNKVKAKDSLFMALMQENCIKRDHSLDLVLRAALKEMAGEMHEIGSSDDYPVFISGRYLELSLLHKIQKYYLENKDVDIIRCLHPLSAVDEEEDKQSFVKDCASRYYVRKLIDTYLINSNNVNEITKKKIYAPRDMRVWTNVRGQRCVNAQVKSVMKSVLEESMSLWKQMSKEARRDTSFPILFVKKHLEMWTLFMKSHSGFLSKLLNASELMAWMCFGITTDSGVGNILMAHSFLQGERELKKNEVYGDICWNYPLTAIYRNDVWKDEPLFKLNEEAFKGERYEGFELFYNLL